MNVEKKIDVTVVVGASGISSWQELIVRGLYDLDCVHSIETIALGSDVDAERIDSTNHVPSLLRLYRELDRKLFGSRVFGKSQAPMHAEILDRSGWGAEWGLTDLILNLSEYRLPHDALASARLGELSLRLGSRSFGCESAGFYEVLGGEDAVTIDIWGYRGGQHRLVARSFSDVDVTSISRTLDRNITNALQLLTKTVRMLATDDRAMRCGTSYLTDSMFCKEAATPTLKEVALYAAGHAFSVAARKVSRKLVPEQWQIAFQIDSPEFEGGKSLRYLEPPRDRFWADPFPIDAGDKLHIFFEEKIYSEAHGTIQVATMNSAGELEGIRPALVKPFHLSYPFIFEFSGDRFMIPEAGGSGKIEVYKAKTFPHEWEVACVLMEDIRAADCTLIERDGIWWMFVGRDYQGLQMGNELLSLFYASSPFGPWHPHPCNPIKLDIRNARGAGNLFVHDGQLYRPAQDCSGYYGRAVNINHVKVLTKTDYEEIAVGRLVPEWDPTAKGLHTYNRHGRLTVIDLPVRRASI